MKCPATWNGLECDLPKGHRENHANLRTTFKDKPPKPPTPTFQAETLARDIAAILIGLLQGRNVAEGNIHFRVEPRRMPTFTIAIGDARDPIHD